MPNNFQHDDSQHEDYIRRWVAVGVLVQFVIVVGGLMFFALFAESSLNATIPSEYYTVLGIVLTGEIQALQALLSHYFRPLARGPLQLGTPNGVNGQPAPLTSGSGSPQS